MCLTLSRDEMYALVGVKLDLEGLRRERRVVTGRGLALLRRRRLLHARLSRGHGRPGESAEETCWRLFSHTVDVVVR